MVMCIKSGVPGSGKTQSMVADLLNMVADMKKTGDIRPIYTNITGLDQAQIPHNPMHDMPPPTVPFVRVEGVMYTIDWMLCPPNSIVVIDEAQKNGFDRVSSQKAVPLYISELAVHRKDYSLDIWLITQAPMLLHDMCRRQCGLHQHYERKFGFKRAFCFEWHECQDRITSKKNAVISQFVFRDKYQKAYHSAEVHTKTKFKLPLWIWIPILAIPLGVVVAPDAYHVVYGAMSGKGVASGNVPTKRSIVKDGVIVEETYTPIPLPARTPSSGPVASPVGTAPNALPVVPPPPVVAGCAAVADRCACFDHGGVPVELPQGQCQSRILGMSQPGQKADISGIPTLHPVGWSAGDADLSQFIHKSRSPSF